MNEIETKILEVDTEAIRSKLASLNAEQIQDVFLSVDWFGPKGLTHQGDDPWFLRVRSYDNKKFEVTWKGKSEILGVSRIHKEINFDVSDKKQIEELFQELNLEKYAHQDKKRISWKLKDWQFDLDQYPNMPAYLEIEGKSEEDIQEALRILSLEEHESSQEGERALISKKYNLDWTKMYF